MSHRLQVLLTDEELADLRKAAAREGLSVSTWVRNSLRRATMEAASDRRTRILAVLERSSQYSFPAPDIEQMLEETERGYLDNGYHE